LSGTKFGGSYIDFVYINDDTNVTISHHVYFFSPSYPSQTAISSSKCQVQVIFNLLLDFVFDVGLDLIGS